MPIAATSRIFFVPGILCYANSPDVKYQNKTFGKITFLFYILKKNEACQRYKYLTNGTCLLLPCIKLFKWTTSDRVIKVSEFIASWFCLCFPDAKEVTGAAFTL